MKKVGIILPVLNEAKNIEILVKKIQIALSNKNYIIQFVDDGSTDETVKIIQYFVKKDDNYKLLKRKKLSHGSIRGSALYDAMKLLYKNPEIDVFIENTQKLITEFLVDFEFLIKKAKEFNLELEDTELFSETYEKIKKDFEKENNDDIYKSKYNLYEAWRIEDHKKSLIEFETNDLSKTFSFLNRWVVFKKII